MPVLLTDAIVLHVADYLESSRILRLATRDAGGTRGGVATNAYDLTKLGTWQKLTVDAKIPDWNTRNYLALSTNTREPVTADLTLDDVSLVPLPVAKQDSYWTARLDPAADQPTQKDKGVRWLTADRATFTVQPPAAGSYHVWLKLTGPATGRVTVELAGRSETARSSGEPRWVKLQDRALTAGEQTAKVTQSGGGRMGRIVVTDDPSGE